MGHHRYRRAEPRRASKPEAPQSNPPVHRSLGPVLLELWPQSTLFRRTDQNGSVHLIQNSYNSSPHDELSFEKPWRPSGHMLPLEKHAFYHLFPHSIMGTCLLQGWALRKFLGKLQSEFRRANVIWRQWTCEAEQPGGLGEVWVGVSELRSTDEHAGRARWQGDWHRQRNRDKTSASDGWRHAHEQLSWFQQGVQYSLLPKLPNPS